MSTDLSTDPSTSPPADVSTPKLLDLDAAAAYLGISARHLRGLQYERAIPFVRVGRRIYFRVTDLDEWVATLSAVER